nr:MAG TPA: hypothetical protein [Caudoviricetes sp.]
MANWNILKEAISSAIKTNNNQNITGQLLQNVLLNIVSNLGENISYRGIATPSTNPGAPDGPVFYFAFKSGKYTNFGNITVADKPVMLKWDNGSWTSIPMGFISTESIAQGPGNSEELIMSQKAVAESIASLEPRIIGSVTTAKIDFNDLFLSALAIDKRSTYYNVVSGRYVCGLLFMFSDSGGHIVHQIFFTNFTLSVLNDKSYSTHTDETANIYIRRYHLSGGTSSIPLGTWSKWDYFGGDIFKTGITNHSKSIRELEQRVTALEQRINETNK